MAGWGGAYLQGCDVFQPNGAIFILLAHTHHSWLQDFTGLQNEHLKKREQTEFRFQQNYYFNTCIYINIELNGNYNKNIFQFFEEIRKRDHWTVLWAPL